MAKRKRERPVKLAEKLKQIRLGKGLTQAQMAVTLELAGNQHYISQYESGKLEPSLPVLLKYARLVSVYVDALIDDELDLPDKLPCTPKHPGIPRAKTKTNLKTKK